MICNLGVVGSNPTRGSRKGESQLSSDSRKGESQGKSEKRDSSEKQKIMGGFQSGQMGQTVNLLSFDFGGSNPSPPTLKSVFAEFCASREQKLAYAETKPNIPYLRK